MELVSTIRDLQRRVDELEAVLEIQRMKARYAMLLDRRHVRGALAEPSTVRELAGQAAALFTVEGEWDGGPKLGRAVGRKQIEDRLASPTLRFARHLFVAPQIEIHGDRATGRWELLAAMTAADGTQAWMQGVEDDEYRREDGRWLHHRMRLTTTFVAPVGGGWDDIWA